MALASSKGIEIFDTESGERVEHPPIVLDSSLNGSGPEPISLAFVGKSGSFLAATTPSSLLSWDWRAGIASRPSYLPEGSIVGLRSLTSGWVAGAEPASEIGSLWSIGAGNTRSQLHGHVGVITCVTTEAGSDARVATGAEDRTLRVYEAANRNLWMVYPGLDSPATSVAFTRDGDYLLAGTMSGQLSAWPCDLAEAGEEAYVFEHHPLHGYEQSRAILVREGRAAAE
ncbi:MAG: WD40 repeat protein [Planctomycetota bacterium]